MFLRGNRGRRRWTARGDPAGAGASARDLGPLLDPAEALLAEAGATFETALRLEQEAYADALVEEAERATSMRDRLLRLRHGRAVSVRLLDGHVVSGRVTAVGVDWFALTGGDRPGGIGPGPTYEVRVDAVAAIEPGADS